MKKKYLLSTILLGAFLLAGTEAMAWHFEVWDNDAEAWLTGGDSFSSSQGSPTDTSGEFTYTDYESHEGGDGPTSYDYSAVGSTNPSQNENSNLNSQYRVVSDYEGRYGEGVAAPEVTIRHEVSVGAQHYTEIIAPSLLEDQGTITMFASAGASAWYSANEIFLNASSGDGGFEGVGSGIGGDESDEIDTTVSVSAYDNLFLEASLSTNTMVDVWGSMSVTLTETELVTYGYVDGSGNANPNAFIGEQVTGYAQSDAVIDFTLSIIDTTEAAPLVALDLTGGEEGAPAPVVIRQGYAYTGDGPVVEMPNAMMPTTTTPPDEEGGAPTWNFDDFWVEGDGMYAFDPLYAVGYEYQITDPNSPLFDSLLLGMGYDADNAYTVSWLDANNILQTSQLTENSGVGTNAFDFGGNSVNWFKITEIDWQTLIDPTDPNGFAILLGFENSGTPEFSMTAITENHPVPEPTTMLLFATGLMGLVGTKLRKKKA